MFDIGLPELLVILVLALLVVGPEELPSFALRAGRLLYQFRRQYEEIASEFRYELERMQREVEAAAGLVSAIDSEPTALELHISTLGALTGRLPPPPASPALQVGLLGAVCGRPLVQATEPACLHAEASLALGASMPLPGDNVACETISALQGRRELATIP